MTNQQIVDYIKENVKKGYSLDQLKQALLQEGHILNDVEEAVEYYKRKDSPKNQKHEDDNSDSHKKDNSKCMERKISEILYALGVWLVPWGAMLLAALLGKLLQGSGIYPMSSFPIVAGIIGLIGLGLAFLGASNHYKFMQDKHEKKLPDYAYILPIIFNGIGVFTLSIVSLLGFLIAYYEIRRTDKKVASDMGRLYIITIVFVVGFSLLAYFLTIMLVF